MNPKHFVACFLLLLLVGGSSQYQKGSGCGPFDDDDDDSLAPRYQLDRDVVVSSAPVQGLHLALKGLTKVTAMWLNPTPFTGDKTFNPECQYGLNNSFGHTTKGVAYSYPAGMFHLTLNKAVMDLSVLTAMHVPVFYRCGDEAYGYSTTWSFTTQPPTLPKNPSLKVKQSQDISISESKAVPYVISMTKASPMQIALIGDMAFGNDKFTVISLTKRVASGAVKAVVHVGDISYADHYSTKKHNNSYIWAEYLNNLQNITAKVPYMLCPGNHERQYDFAAYLNWFQMPTNESGSSSPFWYSFDYMGVHFIMFSTEHNFTQGSEQYDWIESDLKAANKKRDTVPWVMVWGHRPLYCTSYICKARCEQQAPVYRSYLEDLLKEQKVDVFMSGHNHQYERSYPVYKLKATQKNYTDPAAPVYIVNGGAGNPEINDPSFVRNIPWRAFDVPSFETGYLLMDVAADRLHFQYVTSADDDVIDDFSIVRT